MPLIMQQKGAPPVEVRWAESFLLLGRQMARHRPADNVQVVLVVTVPVRDYVAWLTGIGWRLSSFRTKNPDMRVDFRTLPKGTPVSVTTESRTRSGLFHGWEATTNRINIDGLYISLSSVRAASQFLNYEGPPRYRDLPSPGSLLAGTDLMNNWAAANSELASSVSIVGVRKQILAEAETHIGIDPNSMNRLCDILTIPETTNNTTWCSSVIPSTDGGRADLEASTSLVILDGSSAARWLRTITSQFVLCVVDRSQDHESFDEAILR